MNSSFSDNKNYTCSICHDIFYKPVILFCQHTFCKSCIGNVQPKKCPLCKKSYILPIEYNRDIENMLLQLYPDKYKSREKPTSFISPSIIDREREEIINQIVDNYESNLESKTKLIQYQFNKAMEIMNKIQPLKPYVDILLMISISNILIQVVEVDVNHEYQHYINVTKIIINLMLIFFLSCVSLGIFLFKRFHRITYPVFNLGLDVQQLHEDRTNSRSFPIH